MHAGEHSVAAIGVGYGGSSPPTISNDVLRAPALMLRGESMMANAENLVADLCTPPAERPSPATTSHCLAGKRVLLLVGVTSLDNSAWLQFDAERKLAKEELEQAFRASGFREVAPRSIAPLDLAGPGAVLRALNSVLSYARTENSFVGEQIDGPASDITAAMAHALIVNKVVVTLPETATPPTDADIAPVFADIAALSTAMEKAKTELSRLGREADVAKAEAARPKISEVLKMAALDRETRFRGLFDRLSAAKQNGEAVLARLQPTADGKGGLSLILRQWRLTKLVAANDRTLVVNGVSATSGRSTRSLVSSIFGPPVHVAAATSLNYFLFNQNGHEIVHAGISRQYEGPQNWNGVARRYGGAETRPRPRRSGRP